MITRKQIAEMALEQGEAISITEDRLKRLGAEFEKLTGEDLDMQEFIEGYIVDKGLYGRDKALKTVQEQMNGRKIHRGDSASAMYHNVRQYVRDGTIKKGRRIYMYH